LAHPARSAYGSFLTHSARTGSDSGTRASGRIDQFAKRSENDRSLRIRDAHVRPESAYCGRSRRRGDGQTARMGRGGL